MQWLDLLEMREASEVRFSWEYVNNFKHGTSGHLEYTTIAKLASIIDLMLETWYSGDEDAARRFMRDIVEDV